ncbi:MAG: AAA family ATPase [Candidatus Kerfeldbacteria bacterium]|nr:AAA family ATPase [Candidatus Kerfeldbacteria bacterium]
MTTGQQVNNQQAGSQQSTDGQLACPACHGAGCQTCSGLGLVERIGDRWVYWDLKLDSAGIAERSAERGARALIILVLVAFGAAGLAALAFIVSAADPLNTPPWGILAAAQGDPRSLLFAVSLFTDLYLVYRIASLQERIGRVGRQTYGNEPATVPAQVQDVLALPKQTRVNVATTLTLQAQQAVEAAWQLAHDYRSQSLEPTFLFAALFSSRKVIAVLVRLGVDPAALVPMVKTILGHLPKTDDAMPVRTASLTSVLLAAYRRAYERRALHVDVTDLFAAVCTADPIVRDLLDEREITPAMIDNVVAWITIQEDLRRQWRSFQHRARSKPKGVMNRAMTAIATPLLDRFSVDLTQLAKRGFLHPCIARDREMESIFRMLEGGRNAMLIGEPGVGKTALIEGIAQRMVTEDVPPVLTDKRLVSLSIPSLVGSGQGNVEERMQLILNEAVRAGNIVLVLDNIQHLVGVGSAGGATFDLSEILAAALASRRVIALGTTNPADYRRYVEVSSGLASAFSAAVIDEVDQNAAIKILEAKSGGVEGAHGVFFSYAAIEKLVALAKRYVHDRALPDKAIILMEEAAVAVRRARGLHAVVLAEDVAKVVAEKTNVAVTKVTEEESSRLIHLEERMHERIVGQDEAVTAVASALRRARAELRDMTRPIANFLFLGPTGVGKTELAKTVAAVYFGDEQNMIRLDMSEYQDSFSITRLIGAEPGFRGSAAGGYLTERVRSQPFSLVLLDELEKAHPDILNLFLQVMDDGRLTDSAGRTIDFSNVILIATSNAGTEQIQDGIRAGVPLESIKQQLIERVLRQYYRPEFLNRFDQIVVFRPLTKGEIVAVARLMIGQVAARLAQKGIAFEASEAALRELADAGFDPLFGARPLRRVIQERVDNALAKYLLTGAIGRRDRAILEGGGGIRVEEAPSLWDRQSAPTTQKEST